VQIVCCGRGLFCAAAPDDLARHSCVQYRLVADGAVLAWPFEWNRKSRRIAVDGQVIINDADLAGRVEGRINTRHDVLPLGIEVNRHRPVGGLGTGSKDRAPGCIIARRLGDSRQQVENEIHLRGRIG
jgi:hypothetical protein